MKGLSIANVLQRIKKRFRKFALLLILLPVLTGVISYLTEARQDPVYTASMQIELGEFEVSEDLRYTKQGNAKEIIRSARFLEKAINNYGLEMSVSDIRNSITVTGLADNIIILELSGSNENIVSETLRGVGELFVEESDELYHQRVELIEETIRSLENENVTEEEALEKHQFVYDLQQQLLNMKKTQIIDDVTVSEQKPDLMERTVFGVLLGIMLSLSILLIPEIFRDEKE